MKDRKCMRARPQRIVRMSQGDTMRLYWRAINSRKRLRPAYLAVIIMRRWGIG